MRSDWMRRMMPLVLMAEEGGGGGEPAPETDPGPAPETTAPETENPDGNEPEDTEPGYFSQLPGEKAKSDSYKTLWKYRKLDELTDAFIASSAELEKMRKDSARSIVVPEKGDKEGAAAFWKKLGVPDDPAEYKMEALSEYVKDQPQLVDAIRKGCKRMGFTPRQAEGVGEMIANVSKASMLNIAKTINENISTQKEKVAALYKDTYNADIDRQKAAEEDISRYESFLKETGLEDVIGKSILAGNPQIIKAISAYAKKHGGVVTPKGTGLGAGAEKKPAGKPMMHESQDWIDFKANRA